MIICVLSGGLANQLFQYAFANSLKRNPDELIFYEISTFSAKFLKKNTIRNLQLNKFVGIKLFKSTIFLWFIKVLVKSNINLPCFTLISNNHVKKKMKKILIVDGVFLDSEILKFELHKNINFYNTILSNKLKNDYVRMLNIDIENSCVIHVRRGDYVTNPEANKFHGVLNFDYYISAINLVKKQNPKILFYVITDDLNWSKNEFTPELGNFIFPEEEFNLSDIESLALISRFKNQIIANSSFSLWAAYISSYYFGSNESIKIYPKVWWNSSNNRMNFLNNWHCI